MLTRRLERRFRSRLRSSKKWLFVQTDESYFLFSVCAARVAKAVYQNRRYPWQPESKKGRVKRCGEVWESEKAIYQTMNTTAERWERQSFCGTRDGNGNTIGLRGSPFTEVCCLDSAREKTAAVALAVTNAAGSIVSVFLVPHVASARFLDPAAVPLYPTGWRNREDPTYARGIYIHDSRCEERTPSTNQPRAREWRTSWRPTMSACHDATPSRRI